MASGREPDVTQCISYLRSATSVKELLSILTCIGFTKAICLFAHGWEKINEGVLTDRVVRRDGE